MAEAGVVPGAAIDDAEGENLGANQRKEKLSSIS